MFVVTIMKKTVTMKVSQLTTRISSLGQCNVLGASGRHSPCAQEGYVLVGKTEQTYHQITAWNSFFEVHKASSFLTCLGHWCRHNSDKHSKDPSWRRLDLGLPKWVALELSWSSGWGLTGTISGYACYSGVTINSSLFHISKCLDFDNKLYEYPK